MRISNSIAELRQQIRHDLRVQHPEWVEPNGGCPKCDSYEPLLDELGLRDCVIVHQNRAAVEEYLEAADAGLYTSEYESFGLSILETAFYGKPVVAFDVGGIPEVVGDSCPLYPFGDLSAAAAALDALAESPDLARELGKRSRNRVLERFSADRIVPRYEALYRRVVAGTEAQLY